MRIKLESVSDVGLWILPADELLRHSENALLRAVHFH